MFAPALKKIIESSVVHVERVLPTTGSIYAQIGTEVKPFDHLGNCNVSHSILTLPKKFKPIKYKGLEKYFQFGAKIGKNGSETVTAPFNGYLFIDPVKKIYKLREIESKYTLLAGVWGIVEKVSLNNSVLIKTQSKDINLIGSTKVTFGGELIVFPNPWESLEKYYLNEFSAGAGGKIIYVGNHVDTELLIEASKMGVGGILAGSCDRETFTFAKSRNICFGIFTGFGNLETPEPVYDYLKSVSNRFILFMGEKNILRVPVPEISEEALKSKQNPIIEVVPGQKVVVLEKNYFGQIGEIDNVNEFSIFVRLPKAKLPVEIRVPNFYILV